MGIFLVPPKIMDELTTEPYPPPIRSGSNFTIKCYAHGKPPPKIRIISYDQTDNAKSMRDDFYPLMTTKK